MPTPADVARLANVTPQTIRDFTKRYADFLSPQASPENGARLYTDEDTEILRTVAALRRSGISHSKIAAQLRSRNEVPPVVDVTPSNQAQEPPKNGLESFLAPQIIQSITTTRFDALERRFDSLETMQTTLLRAALLWGIVLGAIGAMVVGGFVQWLLWLAVTEPVR